jgi:vanillate/3-O-methylgallate O-demethylase
MTVAGSMPAAERTARAAIEPGWLPSPTPAVFSGERMREYRDQPVSNYSTLSFDKVIAGEKIVGISANSGYSVNVGGWSSLAVIDEDQIKDGAQVTLVWGEEGGGSAKPTVERHVQVEIRATISTSPLAR